MIHRSHTRRDSSSLALRLHRRPPSLPSHHAPRILGPLSVQFSLKSEPPPCSKPSIHHPSHPHPSTGLDWPDVSFHHSSFPVPQFAWRSFSHSLPSISHSLLLLLHCSYNQKNNKPNKTHYTPAFPLGRRRRRPPPPQPPRLRQRCNEPIKRVPRRRYESTLFTGAFERDAFPKSSTVRFLFCFLWPAPR
ncbi:hypothetical protein LZ32DRAFT_227013 [Colletotrichum eremochloae]|nr:hypothetical protein LZ32DRAFT_227013 [Colletotrichum eremochloae]